MYNLSEQGVTRRTVLKSSAAVLAAAALYGCGSGKDDYFRPGDEYVVDQNNPNYAQGEEMRFSTGAYNCGARCLHKVYVKNGRVTRMTSAGDIPRANSTEFDECPGHTTGKPMQQRACVRGYSYIQHNYQPNRLKYPLWQSGGKANRGNLEGFKRVSWDFAINKIAEEIKTAADNRTQYGYLPLCRAFESTVSATLANLYPTDPNLGTLVRNANESTGGFECARFDTVGMNALGNSKIDRYNTKFLICWALDPSRTTYWQINALWIHTKMKEDGIPMVFITSNLNDSASITGTGARVDTSASHFTGTDRYGGGSGGVVNIPRWLACRPTTDGALVVALMYVLWKNSLIDTQFLKDNAFGFFKSGSANDAPKINSNNYAEVNRLLPGRTIPLTFPDNVSDSNITGTSTGRGDKLGDNITYKVPVGASFEDYLDGLETTWGTSAGDYDGVLDYAAALTGVKAKYIEALAFKYAEPYLTGTGAAMVDTGGGANRAYNGSEWAWLEMCLPAMCGYTNKVGGSCALNMITNPETNVLSPIGIDNVGQAGVTVNMNPATDPYFGPLRQQILINGVNGLHAPVYGTDGRTAEQIIADVKFQSQEADGSKTPLDLSTKQYYISTGKLLNFEVFGCGRNYLNTGPNINKSIEGIKAVNFVYTTDNVMNVSATYSDVVLPRATHFEEALSFQTIETYCESSVAFLMSNMCEPFFETKRSSDIAGMLSARILKQFGEGDGSYTPAPAPASLEDLKGAYESAYVMTDIWRSKGLEKPTWADFKQKLETEGKYDFISDRTKTIVGFRDIQTPGRLYNSTGYINFFSPFWKVRNDMAITGGTRGAAVDTSLYGAAGPSGDYYGPGWRTSTAKYIPVPGGYECMFTNNDPKNGTFQGYTSPASGRTYKLLYMTNKSRNRAHTVFDSTAIIKDQYRQTAKMNPGTAAERGIKDGDMVYVYNDRGCMKIPAELSQTILPGYVSIEHGAWYRAHPTETVTIWQRSRLTPTTWNTPVSKTVPVDVGGAENLLTDDDFTVDTVFSCQTLAAQTGPCEVSLTKPTP